MYNHMHTRTWILQRICIAATSLQRKDRLDHFGTLNVELIEYLRHQHSLLRELARTHLFLSSSAFARTPPDFSRLQRTQLFAYGLI